MNLTQNGLRKKLYVAIGLIVLALVAIWLLLSSRADNLPKPRGYFRIELPEREYVNYTSPCYMQMQLPTYCRVEVRSEAQDRDTCHFDIHFPRFRARLHCSYMPVRGNFEKLIGETYSLAANHQFKATAMKRTYVNDASRKVYGIVYDIEGDAASQLQLYLTDSTGHFFHGSLYFFNRPNSDSIAPVLEFIRQDILQLTETFSWQQQS